MDYQKNRYVLTVKKKQSRGLYRSRGPESENKKKNKKRD